MSKRNCYDEMTSIKEKLQNGIDIIDELMTRADDVHPMHVDILKFINEWSEFNHSWLQVMKASVDLDEVMNRTLRKQEE